MTKFFFAIGALGFFTGLILSIFENPASTGYLIRGLGLMIFAIGIKIFFEGQQKPNPRWFSAQEPKERRGEQ